MLIVTNYELFNKYAVQWVVAWHSGNQSVCSASSSSQQQQHQKHVVSVSVLVLLRTQSHIQTLTPFVYVKSVKYIF